MQEIFVEAAELEAQSAALLPDRETLCYVGCVNLQLNLATITTVQTPVAVAIGGDANAWANSYTAAAQQNAYDHYYSKYGDPSDYWQ